MKHVRLFYVLLLLSWGKVLMAKGVVWYDGSSPVSYISRQNYSPVVRVAIDMFKEDMKAVTGSLAEESSKGKIEIIELSTLSDKDFRRLQKRGLPYGEVIAKNDAFYIGVHEGHLVVMGDNGRGTAYGILELSRMAGVSPWTWWGDVRPRQRQKLEVDEGFMTVRRPSVEYRGISITNADWSLKTWHADPQQVYENVFKLLLRLRANMLFLPKGNGDEQLFRKGRVRSLAESYGIMISEQKECSDGMDCASVAGTAIPIWRDDCYGYMSRFPKLAEDNSAAGCGVYYHLSYQGWPCDYLWLATTQPGLLYNEMLRAWNHNARKLWIANIHDPKVAAYQLTLFLDMAWNIGDVAAIGIKEHLGLWLEEQFGVSNGRRLLPVMMKFYQLTTIRRPEFMDWTPPEIYKSKEVKVGAKGAVLAEFNAFSFGNELERYLGEYQQLCRTVEAISADVDADLKDAFFAIVKYPVFSATAMAEKHLEAHEARLIVRPGTFHHDEEALSSAARSLRAWQRIGEMTAYYNDVMAGGKWQGLMSMSPNSLSVFARPSLPDSLSSDELEKYGSVVDYQTDLSLNGSVAGNAAGFVNSGSGAKEIPMLGHSGRAVVLERGTCVDYSFEWSGGSNVLLYLAFVPVHPVGDGGLRASVSIDGSVVDTISLDTAVGTDDWAKRVIRGQAVFSVPIHLGRGRHSLTIEALDSDIVLDQWMIDGDSGRTFYRFPV